MPTKKNTESANIATASAQAVNLQALEPQPTNGPQLLAGNFALIAGVKVKVEVVVGAAELSVSELFALQAGSIVPLEQMRDAPLAVRLDGKTIALGTLVVVGDYFGIQISEVLPTAPVANVQ